MSGTSESSKTGSVFVFAADPMVTVTVEQHGDEDDIHFHAGGQGVWIGRMVASLGVPVTLCGPFGGEAGRVAASLVAAEGIALQPVEVAPATGAYVHDRRSGDRICVAETPPAALSRHELDELYGAVLVGALEAAVCVLGGPGKWEESPVPPEMYRRLAADLRSNGNLVLADLSGEHLAAALEGGLYVTKVSQEDLIRDGACAGADAACAADWLERLATDSSPHAVVTRADEDALARIDGELVSVSHPRLSVVDHRGAGDSCTAGIAAGLAQGLSVADALRLGTAAGVLNVTRRGLATGDRREIERLARHVELKPFPSDQEAMEGTPELVGRTRG
jgi:1-phosphofructokinase